MVTESRARRLHVCGAMEPIYLLITIVTVAAVVAFTLRRKRRARE